MRLAVDANVLIAATLGGNTKRILEDPRIATRLTTQNVLDELFEYIPILAEKRGISIAKLLLVAELLPISVVEKSEYEQAVPEAVDQIGHRDPDDAELLALAIAKRLAIWSNDKDFEVARVPWFTTETLLARLGTGIAN